jgi:hypothetical protein
MTRRLVPALFLSLLPAIAAAPAVAQDRTPLAARVTACENSADPSARAAEFTGSMPRASGATALAMRFSLQERTSVRWRHVEVPGWDTWVRAASGAPGFVYAKRIERLDAPASYRAVVTFRWTDAAGHVVRRIVRRTPVCRQPDVRPDLDVARIDIAPRTGSMPSRYVVVVRNTGPSDVRSPLAVTLTIGGVPQPEQSLPDLAADGMGSLTFTAPACEPGTRLTAEVDTPDGIDEQDETDNRLSRIC